MSQDLVQTENEIVIAFVQPVGTDLSHLERLLKECCSKYDANVVSINLTDLITKAKSLPQITGDYTLEQTKRSPGYLDLRKKMAMGTELRNIYGNEVFAIYGLTRVYDQRLKLSAEPLKKTNIYILNSLKHPSEVSLLRATYKESFFLIAVDSPKRVRKNNLIKSKKMTDLEAQDLINTDEKEKPSYGQKMNEVFEQADFFTKAICEEKEIQRFVNLIFGDPKITPTRSEYYMHLAASTAASSGDLSRQVGAVIVSPKNEIISVGKNEVPKFGGGQYSYYDESNNTDRTFGYEANHKNREQLKAELGIKGPHETIDNLTEYVRAVHAEMEALLSCARKGTPLVDSTLYCTTFPCHNCAKHMVGAGIRSVVFIEAYPKSLATDLHHDALFVDEEDSSPSQKMALKRFYGVGPKRYLDLFSQTLSSGNKNSRKDDHKDSKTPWMASAISYDKATPRFPMQHSLAKTIELNAINKLSTTALMKSSKRRSTNSSKSSKKVS